MAILDADKLMSEPSETPSAAPGNREYILDTETTGFSPSMGDRLVEVGVIEMIDRKPTGRYFHEYVDPCREVPDDAVRIHGLTRDDLIQLGNGQKFEDIADKLVSFVRGGTLVIHNAKFDMGFLDFELERCSRQKLSEQCRIFDTLNYANKLHPGKRNNLDALVKRYKVPEHDRSFHGALLDSEILMGVYLAMTTKQSAFSLDFSPLENEAERPALSYKTINPEISRSLPEIHVSPQEKEDHLNYF